MCLHRGRKSACISLEGLWVHWVVGCPRHCSDLCKISVVKGSSGTKHNNNNWIIIMILFFVVFVTIHVDLVSFFVSFLTPDSLNSFIYRVLFIFCYFFHIKGALEWYWQSLAVYVQTTSNILSLNLKKNHWCDTSLRVCACVRACDHWAVHTQLNTQIIRNSCLNLHIKAVYMTVHNLSSILMQTRTV